MFLRKVTLCNWNPTVLIWKNNKKAGSNSPREGWESSSPEHECGWVKLSSLSLSLPFLHLSLCLPYLFLPLCIYPSPFLPYTYLCICLPLCFPVLLFPSVSHMSLSISLFQVYVVNELFLLSHSLWLFSSVSLLYLVSFSLCDSLVSLPLTPFGTFPVCVSLISFLPPCLPLSLSSLSLSCLPCASFPSFFPYVSLAFSSMPRVSLCVLPSVCLFFFPALIHPFYFSPLFLPSAFSTVYLPSISRLLYLPSVFFPPYLPLYFFCLISFPFISPGLALSVFLSFFTYSLFFSPLSLLICLFLCLYPSIFCSPSLPLCLSFTVFPHSVVHSFVSLPHVSPLFSPPLLPVSPFPC